MIGDERKQNNDVLKKDNEVYTEDWIPYVLFRIRENSRHDLCILHYLILFPHSTVSM